MKPAGFNPKARWDRFEPETDHSEQSTFDQPIEVLAWFRNAKLTPRMFTWKGKIYKIKRITYNWQERCGQAKINYFSVSTGHDLYQISYNNTSYSWKLDKVIV